METGQIVVVDADGVLALSVENDLHYKRALEISENLRKLRARIIYPVSAIAEAVTYVRRVLNDVDLAGRLIRRFSSGEYEFGDVLGQDLQLAMEKYFKPKTSKQNTLFDAIVAAVADKYDAKDIFSFDSFYNKKGFKLVTDQ